LKKEEKGFLHHVKERSAEHDDDINHAH